MIYIDLQSHLTNLSSGENKGVNTSKMWWVDFESGFQDTTLIIISIYFTMMLRVCVLQVVF